MKVIVDIYRSAKKEGMYLYVPRNKSLEELPEALMKQFGRADHSMVLVLTPEKKLARADVSAVIAAVEEQGFYLQMPPPPESYMNDIPNDKMPR